MNCPVSRRSLYRDRASLTKSLLVGDGGMTGEGMVPKGAGISGYPMTRGGAI
jgi:hypothetical protein